MTRTPGRPLLALAGVAALLGVLTACGGSADAPAASDPPTKIQFTAGFAPNATTTNIVAGVDQGFFTKQGLDVSLVTPANAADATKLLTGGSVQFAVINSFNQIIAKSQGVGLVSVAATVQNANHGIMSRADAPVTDPKQLEGKTVGMTGFIGNKVVLKDILRRYGADPDKVKLVDVNLNGPALLAQKKVDALGDALDYNVPTSYNQAIGKPLDDKSGYTFLPFHDLGVFPYELANIAVSQDYATAHPDLVRRFLAAWQQATQWSIDHPEDAVAGTVKRYPNLKQPIVLAQWRVLAPQIQSTDTAAHGLGWQTPSKWSSIDKLFTANGVTKRGADLTALVNNTFLPAK